VDRDGIVGDFSAAKRVEPSDKAHVLLVRLNCLPPFIEGDNFVVVGCTVFVLGFFILDVIGISDNVPDVPILISPLFLVSSGSDHAAGVEEVGGLFEVLAVDRGGVHILLQDVDEGEGKGDADHREWDIPPLLLSNNCRREGPKEDNVDEEEEDHWLRVTCSHLFGVEVVLEHGENLRGAHENGLSLFHLVLNVFLDKRAKREDKHTEIEHTDALKRLIVSFRANQQDDSSGNEEQAVDDIDDSAPCVQQHVQDDIDTDGDPNDTRKAVVRPKDLSCANTNQDYPGEAEEDPEGARKFFQLGAD